MVCRSLVELVRTILRRCTRNDDGCFEWNGPKCSKGYGRTKVNGRMYSVHRIMAYARGIIDAVPASRSRRDSVLHGCDNPKCCNPGHLEKGTLSDNMKQCVERGRHKGLQVRNPAFHGR